MGLSSRYAGVPKAEGTVKEISRITAFHFTAYEHTFGTKGYGIVLTTLYMISPSLHYHWYLREPN